MFFFLKVLIWSSGDVIFVPPVTQRSFCAIDFGQWPWGEQNCTLIFGSWTYHEGLLDLQPLPLKGESAVDLTHFVNPRVRQICYQFVN